MRRRDFFSSLLIGPFLPTPVMGQEKLTGKNEAATPCAAETVSSPEEVDETLAVMVMSDQDEEWTVLDEPVPLSDLRDVDWAVIPVYPETDDK